MFDLYNLECVLSFGSSSENLVVEKEPWLEMRSMQWRDQISFLNWDQETKEKKKKSKPFSFDFVRKKPGFFLVSNKCCFVTSQYYLLNPMLHHFSDPYPFLYQSSPNFLEVSPLTHHETKEILFLLPFELLTEKCSADFWSTENDPFQFLISSPNNILQNIYK